VIQANARRFGLDPAAVLAYALEESGGSWGAIGDQGTSYGPLQMHRGGALGAHSAAWAESPAGLIAGMQMMSQTPARGLRGAAAVRAIFQYFGKGTPRAIPKGLARYGEAQQILQGQAQYPTTVKIEGHLYPNTSAQNVNVSMNRNTRSAIATIFGNAQARVIGLPYQGTHGKAFNIRGGSDNWESENAVDFSVPVGTPLYAIESGTVGSQIGSLGQGGRFAGLRLHLQSAGNEWYYAHLSRLAVRAGQYVRKGQLLGWSGEANGVPHLHLAQRSGTPPE